MHTFKLHVWIGFENAWVGVVLPQPLPHVPVPAPAPALGGFCLALVLLVQRTRVGTWGGSTW
jgi:hypothetical protein